MSFWQIMKYTLRALFSFDLDLRATKDDILERSRIWSCIV